MQYGTAFTFVFKDRDWIKKIAIAAVFMLIPLVGQIFLLGWGLEIARRVIKEDPTPLPEWNNFGNLFVDGLKGLVIGFVYALPVIIVQACGQGINIGILNTVQDDAGSTIVGFVLFCFGCLSLFYGIFLAVAVPAAMGHFVATNELGAAFRFGQVLGFVRAAPAAYILVVLTALITPVIAMMGIIFCVVGVLLTFPYAMIVNSYMQGEAYRVARLEMQGVDTTINQGL